MTATNYAELSGPELVHAFNAMLATPAGKELVASGANRYREVTRFADHKTAVARCEALASSIRATNGASRKEDDAPAPKAKKPTRSRLNPEAKITILTSPNPRKPGTQGHASYALLTPGMTLAAYLAKGGRMQDLKWDIAKGNLAISE